MFVHKLPSYQYASPRFLGEQYNLCLPCYPPLARERHAASPPLGQREQQLSSEAEDTQQPTPNPRALFWSKCTTSPVSSALREALVQAHTRHILAARLQPVAMTRRHQREMAILLLYYLA